MNVRMCIRLGLCSTCCSQATPQRQHYYARDVMPCRISLMLNPLAPLFELTRKWVIQPSAPVDTGVAQVVVPTVLFLGICVLAVWVFRREAPRIAEAL